MALDIHVLDGRGRPAELLHQIGFGEYRHLEPAWRLFRERTGLFIDPYADMAFSSGLKPLIQSLGDARPEVREPAARQVLETLIRVLSDAENNGLSIGFFGD